MLLPDLKNEVLRFLDRVEPPGAGPDRHARAARPRASPSLPTGEYALESMSGQARVAIIDVAARQVVGYLGAGETPDGIGYTARVMTGSR